MDVRLSRENHDLGNRSNWRWGTVPDLRSKTPTEILDALGMSCPYPIILVKKTMEKLPAGAILKIVCDLRTTVEDSIPRYCEKHGYTLETVWIKDKHCWELYIQKP